MGAAAQFFIGDLVRRAGHKQPLMHIYDFDDQGFRVARCNWLVGHAMHRMDVLVHELVFVARGEDVRTA